MGGRLEIRLMPGEKDTYSRAAEACGMALSEWVRAMLNAATKAALRGRRTGR
jgi:hypothetical protein